MNTLLYQRGQMQSFVNHHTVVRLPAFLHRAFCLLQEGKKTKVPLLKQIKDVYVIINVR